MATLRPCVGSLLLALGAQLSAAPIITRCDVIPATIAPKQRVSVVSEGVGIVAGTASFDLRPLGGSLETLTFELLDDGSGATASGLELDSGLNFSSAAEVQVNLSLTDASGDSWTETKVVPLSLSPVLPEDLVLNIEPNEWEPGSEFTIMAASHSVSSASATVDFRPTTHSTLSLRLPFSEGRAMTTGMVPAGLSVLSESAVNVLVDVVDLAGNHYRVVKEASLQSKASSEPVPTVSGVTVSPNPIQAGEEFTVTVSGMDVDRGMVMADFRPHVRSILRLPLTNFTGDSTSASGVAPANLPENLQDFATLKVLLFSPSGEQRAQLDELVSLSSIPQPLDLTVGIGDPQPGTIIASESVVVTGSVGDDITGLAVNGVEAQLGEGRFSVSVPLREGRNDLSAVGRDGDGNVSTTSVSVTRDTTAPILNIEVPGEGAIVTQPQVTVAGFVNDLVTGTVNEDDVEVSVNGVLADVSNRSYEVQEFVLVPGDNTIEVTATDRAGNSRSSSILVKFIDEAIQQRILIASGNNQEGIIGNVLAEPLTVEVVDRDGASIEGVPLTFEVSRGDGRLLAGGEEESRLVLRTDEEGQAEVLSILGSRAGEGNNRVTVTSPGFVGEVIFCASGIDGGATRIAALQPAVQTGEAGSLLPQPLSALVTDEGGNPIRGANVRFRVIGGSGTVLGQSTITLASNANGRVAVPFLLGAEEGINVHRVVADLEDGPPEESAIFSATAIVPGAPEETALVGVVLDAGNGPMPGVTAHLEGTALSAVTDEEGQFRIDDCPVGSVRLLVDGSTTTLPGEWPELEFDLVTIAGEENSVDRPIYLLPLDVDNERLVGGAEDVVLSLEGVPGAELTVFANSVTGPNGEDEVVLRWTQVNLERVPMSPPIGSQFMLALTLQPAGVRFDPPVRIQIPNMGAPAGQQVEMFSFDHDLGEFVAVGTATVSDDGSVQASDPGFGLVKSGWHGCVPPPPPCKPWEGDPPMDTPCRKWEAIPPSDECEYTRYKPNDAKITSVEATVDGESSARVFIGETVSFSASAESEFCDGVEYEWDPGDGSGPSAGASFSHEYSEKGNYTATVRAECTGCPTASMSKSVMVEVAEDKLVTVKDESGRAAQGGLLQVVVPPSGEIITASAEFMGGEVPPDRPVWQTPDGEQTGEEVTFRVATATAGLVPVPIFGAIPLGFGSPETATVSCDDGTSVRIEYYTDQADTFSLKTDALSDFVESIERIGDFVDSRNTDTRSFEFLSGDASFDTAWQECDTSNLAFWTWGVSGGFNPLIAAEGTLPLGGPAVAIGWLARFLGADLGIELFLGGSISLQGNLSRDGCGDISGSFPIAGNITIGIRAGANFDENVEISISGSSGITAAGNISVSEQGVFLDDAKVTWDGISVVISVSIDDDVFGGFLDFEFNRQWTPVGPRPFYGPQRLEIIGF